MKRETRPYADLSAVFCDELVAHDAEMFYGARKGTFGKAAELRKKQTTAEELLWEKLRRKQLAGFRFRRQHPIGEYIADFYCHKAKLIIEVDGDIHNTENQKKHDAKRSSKMRSLGIRVLRFTNYHIDSYMPEVLEAISRALAAPPLQGRSGGAGARLNTQ